MQIVYQKETGIFHLYNDAISYIMMILPNGHMGQLYFGKRVNAEKDYSYLLEMAPRPMSSYLDDDAKRFSLEHIKQEYGVYGSTDFRHPATETEAGLWISDSGNIGFRKASLSLRDCRQPIRNHKRKR